MRTAVEHLLDDVAERSGTALDALDAIVSEWLTQQETSGLFDWRYYFVRYPSMLAAPRGIYVGEYDPERAGYGYQIDMLKGGDYRAAFTDPFLLAIWHEIGQPQELMKPEFRSWDYTGSEKSIRLAESGTGMRSLDVGFEILIPGDPTRAALVGEALAPFGLSSDNIVHVNPRNRSAQPLDTQDRVKVGVQIVKALLDAGL